MIGASITNTTGHVRYDEQAIADTWIRGLTPSMAPILDLDLTAGRMMNENDEENRSQVAVIGTDVVDNLLPGGGPPRQRDSRRGRGVPRDRRGQEAGNYAGPEPGQLCRHPDHHLSEAIWIAHQHSHFGQSRRRGPELEAAIDEARAVLRARRHDLPGHPTTSPPKPTPAF